MPHFTARAVLRTDKENSKGACPVSICVTMQRKRSYNATGIILHKDSWDSKKGRVKPGAENATVYNLRIGNELARIERELLTAYDAGTLSHSTAKAAGKNATDFYTYATGIIEDMKAKGQGVTARRYERDLPAVREYAGDTLYLTDINKDWLKGFEKHCHTTTVMRRKDAPKIAQNTIWSRFKFLRKILLQAVEDGEIKTCPLGVNRGGYPMPQWEKVPKDYLTMDELDRMMALMGSEGLTEAEDLALSYFLIECTAGIRHSDWSRFTIERLITGDALKVSAKKTGEPVYVPIGKDTRLSKILAHIEAKGYKYTSTEGALTNKYLKVLAKVAGINKPITTHTGRHSAATLHLEKGYSREAVAQLLGISIKVVDTYAKQTRQKLRNEHEKYGGL